MSLVEILLRTNTNLQFLHTCPLCYTKTPCNERDCIETLNYSVPCYGCIENMNNSIQLEMDLKYSSDAQHRV